MEPTDKDYKAALVEVFHTHMRKPIGMEEIEQLCIKCGKFRTKDEGGTTFVCIPDKCWEEEHNSRRTLRELLGDMERVVDKVANGQCCTGEGGAFRLIHTMKHEAQVLVARIRKVMGKE